MTIYKHKKRGTFYEFGGIAKVQANNWFELDWATGSGEGEYVSIDMQEVVVYRSVDNPDEIWVRPYEEFFDGRFEKVTE